MYNRKLGLVLCFDWVVPDFILWDIFGESARYYDGRETYSLDVLSMPYTKGEE